MSTLSASDYQLFGLIELDATGTVLYCRPDGEAGKSAPSDICGCNFYTEVAPFENVEEFRQRLGRFAKFDSPAESFIFDCRFAGGRVVPVRVLLARMRQRADGSSTESLLVHIRKV
jgi:hypothetical protein